MVYVYCALIELAIVHYLNRQRCGLLLKVKQSTALMRESLVKNINKNENDPEEQVLTETDEENIHYYER